MVFGKIPTLFNVRKSLKRKKSRAREYRRLNSGLAIRGSMHTPWIKVRCADRFAFLLAGGQVKLLKGILVAVVLISASQVFLQQAFMQQAFAEEDTSSEIRLLKAKLKQLEQRVENQGRKRRELEVQARASAKRLPAYKAASSAFDPCPAGKVCYKGITLTFGGWIDLAAIYRSRNIASIPDRSYSSIPFAQSKKSQHAGNAVFGAPEPVLVVGRGRCRCEYAFCRLRRNRFRGRSADREFGRDQLVQFRGCGRPSLEVDRARSRPSLPGGTVMVAQCAEQGRHRSALGGCTWRDRFRIGAGLHRRSATPHSGSGRISDRNSSSRSRPKTPRTSFVGGNVPCGGHSAVGPQGVLVEPEICWSILTGPGGSFFNKCEQPQSEPRA